jgi:adenylylsulfate kinase
VSWVIWVTGPPGSGKSTVVGHALARLQALGDRVTVLELDEIRRVITPEPGYSDQEREVVYRSLVFMAMSLAEAGFPVIVDATAHRRAWREMARARIPRFAEVQLLCPIEVCREREAQRRGGHAPRGVYARAGRPGATVPGVDVPYEPARAPEVSIDTAAMDAEGAGTRVAELARALGGGAMATPRLSPGGWVIWITGRPGSGKTTLARGVGEALESSGLRTRVLELAGLRDLMAPAAVVPAPLEAIAHRALAYTAKLLAEAGLVVIVDATTPRRAWREMARAIIPRFAEVQLLCPVEICVEREQAARWGARGAPPGTPPPPPEICLDYELSLMPDLTLHTHVQGHWSAVEEVLLLARRLIRSATTPDRHS